jgi:hypothetical protein
MTLASAGNGLLRLETVPANGHAVSSATLGPFRHSGDQVDLTNVASYDEVVSWLVTA